MFLRHPKCLFLWLEFCNVDIRTLRYYISHSMSISQNLVFTLRKLEAIQKNYTFKQSSNSSKSAKGGRERRATRTRIISILWKTELLTWPGQQEKQHFIVMLLFKMSCYELIVRLPLQKKTHWSRQPFKTGISKGQKASSHYLKIKKLY